MIARDVRKLVVDQIANRWDDTNSHRVNLRSALVAPSQSKMILRLVRNGKIIRKQLTPALAIGRST
jgi:hypothetical protein